MTFRNAPFPDCLSKGTSMATMRFVDVAGNRHGKEFRFQRSTQSRRRFNAVMSLNEKTKIADYIAHFEVMGGKEYSFPFNYPHDNATADPITSLDVQIGTGDGATATFQLKRELVSGAFSAFRNIILPVPTTVLVAVAGTLKTETTHYTVNYETGVVTFTSGNIPTAGQAVTAGCRFYHKVRYDIDDMESVIEAFNVGAVPSMPLVEVL